MKFNEEKRKKELENVPVENRVWIYNAEIILEFLQRTFVPIQYFLKDQPIMEERISKDDYRDYKLVQDATIKVDDLYEMYLSFRSQVDYTAPVENKWKFQAILKKVRARKNGWEFVFRRLGLTQTPAFAPLKLRTELSPQDQLKYPVPTISLAAAQVEMPQEEEKN